MELLTTLRALSSAPMSRGRIHAAFTIASLALGCSRSPTTAAGPLGTVDLRAKLPAGVTVPAEAQLASHEVTQRVCGPLMPSGDKRPGFEGTEPAEVAVRWKTFSFQDRGYVASCSVEVTKASPGLTLKLGETTELSFAPKAPTMGVAQFEVHCLRRASGSLELDDSDRVVVTSDGTSQLRK
jgi:hypothetical protein